MGSGTNQIYLSKGEHQFVVRYGTGDETHVYDALVAMVEAKQLDWFDAALLSHQMNKRPASPPQRR